MKTKLWRLVIEKLFCKHQWSVHAVSKRTDRYKDGSTREYVDEVLECKICGKIKKIKY